MAVWLCEGYVTIIWGVIRYLKPYSWFREGQEHSKTTSKAKGGKERCMTLNEQKKKKLLLQFNMGMLSLSWGRQKVQDVWKKCFIYLIYLYFPSTLRDGDSILLFINSRYQIHNDRYQGMIMLLPWWGHDCVLKLPLDTVSTWAQDENYHQAGSYIVYL